MLALHALVPIGIEKKKKKKNIQEARYDGHCLNSNIRFWACQGTRDSRRALAVGRPSIAANSQILRWSSLEAESPYRRWRQLLAAGHKTTFEMDKLGN